MVFGISPSAHGSPAGKTIRKEGPESWLYNCCGKLSEETSPWLSQKGCADCWLSGDRRMIWICLDIFVWGEMGIYHHISWYIRYVHVERRRLVEIHYIYIYTYIDIIQPRTNNSIFLSWLIMFSGLYTLYILPRIHWGLTPLSERPSRGGESEAGYAGLRHVTRCCHHAVEFSPW